MLQFKYNYFIYFVLLLITEILIEKYATGFVRYTLGDYLCVLLLYTLIKSFLKISTLKAAVFVLVIAYTVELLQLTNLEKMYPTEYAKILRIIIGTSFSFGDLLAYTFGFITLLMLENYFKFGKKEEPKTIKNKFEQNHN
ncbi:DUF2809 domain-containing protein [Polaribacter sp.]|uniref:ribosomal maturation YjgA family protein n=1 Tax=Polaribacter sp. TaxID=1920175 RepID=UPI003EF593AD